MTRLTTQRIVEMKTSREVIAMVTAYDATFARLIDQAGADVLLVGDSLGMVVQGHGTTLPVTMEHMIYHCQAVVRGSERAVVVCDLPFMSYQVSVEQALTNGGRLMAEGGCQAVKLEGGQRTVRAVRALVDAGIPVCGHIGLTPQSVNALGGFLVQGRSEEAAKRLLEDALALQDAGAFALVLEGMPLKLAVEITEQLAIPTVGIGAGAGCDGQVLVCYDLLGLYEAFKPKFVKRYATLGEATREAVGRYVEEVRQRAFPDDEHSFS